MNSTLGQAMYGDMLDGLRMLNNTHTAPEGWKKGGLVGLSRLDR